MFSKIEQPENIEKEPKEIYINERLTEAKDKIQEYFSDIYRNIPTKVNYQDNAEILKISYHFEDDNLNINIKTPENLSDKTIDNLRKTENNFLVFQDIIENETILKRMQDFFFLSHEYIHGINQVLLQEYRYDISQIIKEKQKKFGKANKAQKEKLLQKERNSVFPVLGESLPISLERIIVEKILGDKTANNQEKDNARKFWKNHKKSLLSEKLENDPESKYSELDGAMIYYKLYQKFGEEGILDFIRRFKFDKLSKIKKYSNPEQKVLSEEYKEFLEMDAIDIMKEYTTSEYQNRQD